MKSMDDGMDFTFGTSEKVADLPHRFPSSTEYERAIPLTVTFRPFEPRLFERDDIIENIFQSVPLANLKKFLLDSYSLPSTIWEDTFRDLPKLRSITLVKKGLPDLVDTLSIHYPPPPPNTEGPTCPDPFQVFAPSLEQIELVEIGFIDRWNGEFYRNRVERLLRALTRRQEVTGRALERLDLYDCRYLYSFHVQHLSRVVGSLKWDEKEREGGDGTAE